MNRTCAFTICAKNYIGLAQVLGRSLQEHCPNFDFRIFVADEFDRDRLSEPPANLELVSDTCGIAPDELRDMAFKYNLVEFCTSVKPFCMSSLLAKGYEQVFYFDPDVVVFAPLTPVLEALKRYVAVVTPHRLDLDSDLPCRGGIFNLGFLAVRKGPSTDRMLRWWGDRLRNGGCIDPMRGFFTDQKWMDHLPLVLENGELFVTRHPGLNYGPWNFEERLLVQRGGRFFVGMRNPSFGREAPLVFLHFSAFDYRALGRGEYGGSFPGLLDREPALLQLAKFYGEQIAGSEFSTFIDKPYSFAAFSDGTLIQQVNRRIFKRLREAGYSFGDPFDSHGAFFLLLARKRMLAGPGANSDRTSRRTVGHLDRKVRVIDAMASLLVRLIGHSAFSLLARFLIQYLHPANRARLLGREYRKLDIEPF